MQRGENIPIHYKGQQQQGYQPQQASWQKSGEFGQKGEQGQQFGGQQQQYGQKPGEFQGSYQQQPYGQQQYGQGSEFQGRQEEPSTWEKIKETFTGKQPEYQQEQGYQQKQGFGYGGGVKGVEGKMVVKELPEHINASDLTQLHLLLLLSGHCYVKEHVMLSLCQDRTGAIKKWHKNVTIKNLDKLIDMAHTWGLKLPFSVPLEQREQEIKQALKNVGPVLTDGEVLKDLKQSGCLLEQHCAQAYFLGCCNKFNELAREMCSNTCNGITDLKEAIHKTEEFFPIPLVKQVVIKEGVSERR